MAGAYSVADIALVPWIQGLDFVNGKARVGYADFPTVDAWVERFAARSAVQRRAPIPARPGG